MTEYDKELQTGTPEYEEAIAPLDDAEARRRQQEDESSTPADGSDGNDSE